MSKEQRALVRHLFSEITGALEIAHSLATEGQGPDLKSQHAREIAQRILNVIDDAASFAAAIGAMRTRGGVPTSIGGTRSRASRPRRRILRTV